MSFESNQSREHRQRGRKRLVALGGALALAGIAVSGLFAGLGSARGDVPSASSDRIDSEAADVREAESAPGTGTGSALASDPSDPRPAVNGDSGTTTSRRTDAVAPAPDDVSPRRSTQSFEYAAPSAGESIGGGGGVVAQPSPTPSPEVTPVPTPAATPTATPTPQGEVLAPVLDTASGLTGVVEDVVAGLDETSDSLTEPVEPVTELLDDSATPGADLTVDVHLATESP